jgi:GNAT superfamily N-acetyltransferase
MSERDWLGLVRAGMPPFWKAMALDAGGSVWERDGVLGSIIPAAPGRSVFNSVFYEDTAPLLGCLDDLAEAYAGAGIEAWTVWVPEGDTDAAAGLEAAGHRLDAKPRAMAMATADLKTPDRDPALQIRQEYDMAELARLNEIAYGYPAGDFVAVAALDLERLHVYFAEIEGEVVGTVALWDHGSDAILAWVATLPEARGSGVSTNLCARAVAEAAGRGMETTTLQASKLGYPVYERIGYRDHGVLGMWERRRGAVG